MEVRNFKKLYNNYINEKSIENESLLLKSMVYCEEFIICVDDEGEAILFKDDNNNVILYAYTDINEIPEEFEHTYKLSESTFEAITFFINTSIVDYLCINSQSDNIVFTHSQIMDLNRQKEFNNTSDPFILNECENFLNPAYKISELNENDNKIMEIYDIYMNGNENSLSDFYDELINNATFYVKVLPEENASIDEKGHPLISKERVLQFVKEDKKRQIILYMTMKHANDNVLLDEKDYFSIVNFDDIIKMIDNSYGQIESIRIIGDKDLTIPVEVFNEIKVQNDRIKRNNNALIISGKVANTVDYKYLELELKKYFAKIEQVEKVWLNLESYLYNDKTENKVYNITIKLLDNKENNIEEDLKEFFENKCFEISYIGIYEEEDDDDEDEFVEKNSDKLIYDKDIYLKEIENNKNEQILRRQKSNKIIKSLGIACYENLSLIEASNEVVLKDFDDICKRAIAALAIIQVACDIRAGEYEKPIKIISKVLEHFEVKSCLNSKEQRIFDGTYTEQDVIDMDWEYESYWALVWALGLIDDISDASKICDCGKAMDLVFTCKDLKDFKQRCKIRDINEILDMLDLYYRYHWAINEKTLNPETEIGDLDSSIVIERRRGLEWLISPIEDWYDIDLSA